MATAILERDQPERVLNDYNAAGTVLFFGGRGAQVAIDGRTDYYGAEYIERYLKTIRLEGDFEGMLDELAPTIALLDAGAPMAWYLQAHAGWVLLDTEEDWVLLAPGANQG